MLGPLNAVWYSGSLVSIRGFLLDCSGLYPFIFKLRRCQVVAGVAPRPALGLELVEKATPVIDVLEIQDPGVNGP